jgi:hypothetical protein
VTVLVAYAYGWFGLVWFNLDELMAMAMKSVGDRQTRVVARRAHGPEQCKITVTRGS